MEINVPDGLMFEECPGCGSYHCCCGTDLDQGPWGMWGSGSEFNGKAIATPGSDGAMPPGSGTIKSTAKKRSRLAAKSYQNLVMRGRP
jgi:hypothetical protein